MKLNLQKLKNFFAHFLSARIVLAEERERERESNGIISSSTND